LTKGIRGTREEVRKFGILFAVVFTAVAVYSRYRGIDPWYWFLVGAGGFLLTGHVAPGVLRPLYVGWMKFANLLGWINTRVLLGIFFYLVLTPIGIVLRLTGKDLLDTKLDRHAVTYWKKREVAKTPREQYERLF
jgi:hypothetical protein